MKPITGNFRRIRAESAKASRRIVSLFLLVVYIRKNVKTYIFLKVKRIDDSVNQDFFCRGQP